MTLDYEAANRAREEQASKAKSDKTNGGNGHDPRSEIEFTAAELMTTEISEPTFVVPGLIVEGLAVISGRPKMGKTTFATNIADALARGGLALGSIQCPQYDVLFLALEDNRRRLRKRIRMMLDAQGLGGAPKLHFRLEWPRLDDGGLEKLDKACAANRRIKLVIIDTWEKICPRRRKNQDEYEHEAEAASCLQKLAAKYQIAIIIIHHSRKGPGSEDFVDDVLGSTGLTGAVDTIIGFRRKRGTSEAEISIAGRDVDECELALAGDQTTGLWRLLGDAQEHRMSRQRKAIRDLLSDGKLRSIKQISDILDERYDNVRVLCAKMFDQGQLTRVSNTFGLPDA